ncbi:hypothetical protein [Ottowia testudinis]|uniref:Uncharacterized protein n=1 Tax=Ottowia testudinis TaxID=2816950 RepID=A0A975CMU2_9BURK|nr:hypothetical protein [Ottowia testudinis]QTD47084.1 hypothetical protein J1M35_09570 [Ottowia testudinis]
MKCGSAACIERDGFGQQALGERFKRSIGLTKRPMRAAQLIVEDVRRKGFARNVTGVDVKRLRQRLPAEIRASQRWKILAGISPNLCCPFA